MNKVAKEQLGLFKPKKINVPEFNLESRDYLHSILTQHEQNSFINLGKTMMRPVKVKFSKLGLSKIKTWYKQQLIHMVNEL